jgi:threonine synthase
MSRCLAYFNKDKKKVKTFLWLLLEILVVLSRISRRCGVEVIILYPSGKVSNIQEKQLTTLGQNIKALEVDVLMIVRTW